MVDILLDSTFLLPTFGVEVEDIGADDFKAEGCLEEGSPLPN